jgi:DNA-binding MarR family transcriptional regulator
MRSVDEQPGPQLGAAFLLAQLGAHAAGRYAARVAELELDPAQTGVLHLIAREPGQSQQTLAARLGVAPSRVVGLLDTLEARSLLERRRHPGDRRNHALHLTEAGTALLGQIRALAVEHEATLTAGLSPAEHAQLVGLLRKVADDQGLTPGVHPGYRNLRR